MFKLTLERRDGSPLILRYDPRKSLLTDQAGHRVDLSPVGFGTLDTAAPGAVARVSEDNPTPKSHHITRLKIQLGLACNYACSYCSQAADRQADRPDLREDDVGVFLARLPEWFHPVPGSDLKIEFWGGEPLVYWKTLKPLAEGLRTRYPAAVFWMTTNGSLLDAEKIQWLYDLGFSINLSHDGPGQPLRGPDPFDDPVKLAALRRLYEMFAPLGRMSFHCVLSLPHHSPLAVRSHIAGKLGVPVERVPISTEGLLVVHDAMGLMVSPRTEEDQRRIRHDLFEEIARADMITTNAGAYRLIGFFKRLGEGVGMEGQYQRCGMDRPDQIAVNLDGDVLVCQNTTATTHKIGSVHDFDAIRLTHSTHWGHRQECNACPMLELCGGSCMFLKGAQRQASCDNEFTLALPYFRLALYLLTNALLTRIEGERIRFPGVTSFEF